MRFHATVFASLYITARVFAAEPVVIADFEGETYGEWKVEGTAFGKGPARGTLPRQMTVEGFVGKGLVNSFHGGDDSTGQLTSPTFKLERKFINFLIGGGGWEKETSMSLLIDGKVVRTAHGPNTEPGGSEALETSSWDVAEFAGREASIVIIDQRKGGWGHLNVDQIVQADTAAAAKMVLEKNLTINGTHLIVPVSNEGKRANSFLLGIYDGEKLIQNFTIALPNDGDAAWLAAYPLQSFGIAGKTVRIASADGKRAPESCRAAFDKIKVGAESDALAASDYAQPYRNQFHPSTRHGWNNDPNGMVFHGGKYHLYYQYNPFGIFWGNMHWGHLESTDLIHWSEKPVSLFQKTVKDMAFSGGGFVDFNNSAGLGKDTQFAAFTSTGRGECLAYSKDGGITFTELPENPVVKHQGRDPKVMWFAPEQKWIMVVYSETRCAETDAIPPTGDKGTASRHMAFYESKNLRQWTRTGGFTDADREAVFECPELFELPIDGKPGETRWILLGAQNRYFVGKFDGKTFHKESGPHGSPHGIFYAAQTFSDLPDARRIQIGWARTDSHHQQFPDQLVNQSFTLPHELTLRPTERGLRVHFNPVKETEQLRGDVLVEGKNLTVAQTNELLQKCRSELTEVLIEFADAAPRQLQLNGMDAGFKGRSARIFTDRTFNEVYADEGSSYEVRKRPGNQPIDHAETKFTAPEGTTAASVKIFRLKSIWSKK